MKTTSARLRTLAAVLMTLPALAPAHPGHSIFDYTAGPPHAGHGLEFANVLLAVVLTAAIFGAARWLTRRR